MEKQGTTVLLWLRLLRCEGVRVVHGVSCLFLTSNTFIHSGKGSPYSFATALGAFTRPHVARSRWELRPLGLTATHDPTTLPKGLWVRRKSLPQTQNATITNGMKRKVQTARICSYQLTAPAEITSTFPIVSRASRLQLSLEAISRVPVALYFFT